MSNINKISKPYKDAYAFEQRKEFQENSKLYSLEIEMTSVCYSGCNYCYASSVKNWDTSKQLTTIEIKNLIDKATDLGVQSFSWPGGEPLARKDWYDILSYVKQNDGERKKNFLASTLSLVKNHEIAKKVVETTDDLLFHFDSIVKDTFLKTHKLGSIHEWENSLRGLHLLLENGFNPKNIHLAIPIIKPLIGDMKATFDYFFDFIGVGSFSGAVFKPAGRGKAITDLIPTFEEIRYVYELRAKKMNNDGMLLLGPSSTGKLYCETTMGINSEGYVKGCSVIPDSFIIDNIRNNELNTIWKKYRSEMLCNEPKGYCATCESSDICYGCRANAYYFCGDYFNSDPTCWRNPENKQIYTDLIEELKKNRR